MQVTFKVRVSDSTWEPQKRGDKDVVEGHHAGGKMEPTQRLDAVTPIGCIYWLRRSCPQMAGSSRVPVASHLSNKTHNCAEKLAGGGAVRYQAADSGPLNGAG